MVAFAMAWPDLARRLVPDEAGVLEGALMQTGEWTKWTGDHGFMAAAEAQR